MHKINVVIEKDENGFYAWCPALEGCQSQGESMDEVMDNIREAAELYLETLTTEEIETLLSREILTTAMEIKIA